MRAGRSPHPSLPPTLTAFPPPPPPPPSVCSVGPETGRKRQTLTDEEKRTKANAAAQRRRLVVQKRSEEERRSVVEKLLKQQRVSHTGDERKKRTVHTIEGPHLRLLEDGERKVLAFSKNCEQEALPRLFASTANVVGPTFEEGELSDK